MNLRKKFQKIPIGYKVQLKKPGSLSKELGVPEEDNIPSSLINKEIKKLKKKDKDPKKKGIQGLSKRNLSKFRKLNLAKTLKNL